MPSTQVLSWLVKPEWISVVLMEHGEVTTFPLHPSHPTFAKMARALQRRELDRVPKLVSLARHIANQTHGNVEVKGGKVYYKNRTVDNAITHKIVELLQHKKSVAHLLKFMDNLYEQPDPATVIEVFDWLANGRFALTDDGCFLAYKRVRPNWNDWFTDTICNKPGQRPLMPRKDVNPDRLVECSNGLHFCSKTYLPHYYGGQGRIIEVKVNPKDVVAIPKDFGFAKGRTWTYEVMREVQPGEMIEGETDTAVMLRPVIYVAKERDRLKQELMNLPSVKRLLRRKKLTLEAIGKASNERLESWYRRFAAMDIAPDRSRVFENPLEAARVAAGLTPGQVAEQAKLTVQQVIGAERSVKPPQSLIDQILTAIATLQGNSNLKRTAIGYPVKTEVFTPRYTYEAHRDYDEEDVDADGDGEDEEDEEDEESVN